MKSSLPTAGKNPRESNSRAELEKNILKAAKDMKIASEKGRIARKRKKYIYNIERQAYIDLLISVMVELAERKLREKRAA